MGPDTLNRLLTRPAQTLPDGLLRMVAPDAPPSHYDDIAAFYDNVVGSRLYNRLFWGNSPSDYADFARQALASCEGPVLDAGCGSLVFTAQAYGASDVPMVFVDASAVMLRRAMGRHRRGAWMQADLMDLPFDNGAFPTVLCFAVAHVVADRAGLFRELARVTRPGGELWLTALVSGTRFGDRWLRFLVRRGEVHEVVSADTLAAELGDAGFEVEVRQQGSAAYLVGRRTTLDA